MAGGGSVLKRLKGDLEKHDLLRHQAGKKRKKTVAKSVDQRERDHRVLASIREAFNPFDTKKNREKHHILSVNHTGDHGRPGASKLEAETQRKQTYEAQKRLRNRVGGLVDRRFGERDRTMSAEDKMVARYAHERLVNASKHSIFDLDAPENDTETLTHGGQTLAFADDFAEDDLGVGSEDENSYATPHKRRFGEADEGEDRAEPDESEEGPEKKKSKHDVMREVIAKSKLHKLMRQQTKEQNEQLVDQLNNTDQFDALMAELQGYDESHEASTALAQDAYDLAVREMAFDRRAQPGDRTKTAEELQKESEERQQKLETERQARMEGDDLEDGLDVAEAGNDAELFGLRDGPGESGEPREAVAFEDDDSESSGDENSRGDSNIPRTYVELKALLGSEDQLLKLNSLLKRCDPARGAGNTQKREKLVPLICRYAASVKDENLFNGLVAVLRELAPKYEVALGQYFRDAVDSIHASGGPGSGKRGHLLTLVLIGALFSTSDQWHVVVNAAVLVITRHLSGSVSIRDFAVNLFLCDLLLFYQRLSKRYIPEIGATLLRVLSAAAPAKKRAVISRYVRQSTDTIKLSEEFGGGKSSSPPQLGLGDLKSVSPDQLVVMAARTVDKASSLWRSSPAYPEIFGLIHIILESLPSNKYIHGVVDRLGRALKFSRADRRPLRLQDLRPVALITHAPMFDENYNPEIKGHDQDPEKREMARLKAQLKKEKKSTLKEIRRDTEFEAREQLRETRAEAAEYHAKLARITNQINSEEGAERNLYEREKRARQRRK